MPWIEYRRGLNIALIRISPLSAMKKGPLPFTHPFYTGLGRNYARRRKGYRSLFNAQVEGADLKDIRAFWQTGTPLGSAVFKKNCERKLESEVGQGEAGLRKHL